MKLSQRLKDEDAYVFAHLPGEICARCGATLQSMNEVCTAEMLDPCPGFLAIDAAKQNFHDTYRPNVRSD